MSTRFLLDPDYADFNSNEQFKFKTLHWLDGLGATLITILTIFYVPCAIFMAFAGLYIFFQERAYETEGHEIDITVSNCEMVGREGRAQPRVTFAYQVEGVMYERREALPNDGSGCNDYPNGTTLHATYLPSNPQESRINSTPAWQLGIIYVGSIGFSTAMTCGTVVFLSQLIKYVRDRGRYKRLLQAGKLLNGEIVTAEGKMAWWLLMRRYRISVTYHIQTPDGRSLTRKQSRYRPDLRNAELPPPGTPVSVLYADDDAVVML